MATNEPIQLNDYIDTRALRTKQVTLLEGLIDNKADPVCTINREKGLKITTQANLVARKEILAKGSNIVINDASLAALAMYNMRFQEQEHDFFVVPNCTKGKIAAGPVGILQGGGRYQD